MKRAAQVPLLRRCEGRSDRFQVPGSLNLARCSSRLWYLAVSRNALLNHAKRSSKLRTLSRFVRKSSVPFFDVTGWSRRWSTAIDSRTPMKAVRVSCCTHRKTHSCHGIRGVLLRESLMSLFNKTSIAFRTNFSTT